MNDSTYDYQLLHALETHVGESIIRSKTFLALVELDFLKGKPSRLAGESLRGVGTYMYGSI
jgi:hypothetical protein